MPVVEFEYLGGDLVIPKETAEKELGLHPGDRIEIRAKTALKPVAQSPEKSRQIAESLERLRDVIDPSDLANWETQRNELWAKWRVPT